MMLVDGPSERAVSYPVRYDPQDPDNNDLGKVGGLSVYVYGFYAVGGGLILAGLVLLFRPVGTNGQNRTGGN